MLALAERSEEAPTEEAAALALHKADTELERLERQRRTEPGRPEALGPIGLEIRLPEGLGMP